MADILVLCPTRGRPGAARETYQSFVATAKLPSSEIVFLVDDDDPELAGYLDGPYTVIQQAKPGNMVAALNAGAMWALEHTDAQILGFIGDDHRFRTPGWDTAFADDIHHRGAGMVYGNDTIWLAGEIPTQIFMSAEIVRALGWMGLPTCTHLYIDNVWRVIGEHLQILVFRPDITIEHIHPAAGRTDWDEGHLRVNTREMYEHDAQAFHDWLLGSAEADVERVRSAIGR